MSSTRQNVDGSAALVAAKRGRSDVPFNKHRGQSKTAGDWVVDIIIALILVVIVCVVIYPLWFIIIASFFDPTAVAQGKVNILPQGFSLGGYAKIRLQEHHHIHLPRYGGQPDCDHTGGLRTLPQRVQT